MSKNPFFNALAATGYISLVALLMSNAEKIFGHNGKTILIPIAMVSLFTLSATVMSYIFGSQPLQLYLDGKKKEGVNLFVKTVGIFAMLTVLAFLLLFLGIRI